MKNINPTQTAAWQALQKHFDEMKDVTIADLFAKDGDRFSKFSATFDDQMLVDYSKNRITEETLAKLQDLAKECDLAGAIKSMFSGEKINRTENRAVLHVALRNRSNTPILVDGVAGVRRQELQERCGGRRTRADRRRKAGCRKAGGGKQGSA